MSRVTYGLLVVRIHFVSPRCDPSWLTGSMTSSMDIDGGDSVYVGGRGGTNGGGIAL